MSKKIDAWTCDTCKTAYFEKAKADLCEAIHAKYKNLKLSAIVKWEDNEKFPAKILMEDESYSGQLAEYKLISSGSCEDYYQD